MEGRQGDKGSSQEFNGIRVSRVTSGCCPASPDARVIWN